MKKLNSMNGRVPRQAPSSLKSRLINAALLTLLLVLAVAGGIIGVKRLPQTGKQTAIPGVPQTKTRTRQQMAEKAPASLRPSEISTLDDRTFKNLFSARGKKPADNSGKVVRQVTQDRLAPEYEVIGERDEAAFDHDRVPRARTARVPRSFAAQERDRGERGDREQDERQRRESRPQRGDGLQDRRDEKGNRIPRELHLTKARPFKGDLRNLPYRRPASRERRELELDPTPRFYVPPDGANSQGQSSAAPSITEGPSITPQLNAPAPAPLNVFEGLDRFNWGSGSPPDTNGDVGPTYYIQTVNSSIGIFRKSDGFREAAFTFDTFMSQGNFGNLCDTNNFGDPVVVYDTFEDRWIISDFAFLTDGGGNVLAPAYQCIAASQSGDPLAGGWNFYSIQLTDGLNDYPKFGIWPDGLYMSANMFTFGAGSTSLGARAWVFNKTQMYAGSPTVKIVVFNIGGGDFTVIPSNARLQTGTPPLGRPNLFLSTWLFTNALSVYKFHVDWNSISLSTFTGPDTPIAATSWPNAAVANAPQPGTATLLDVLQIRAMVQNQYTNFGGTESLWVPHTVRRANTVGAAAPRWYQVNVTGGNVNPAIPQATTWDPDGNNNNHRFMPSLALDRAGNMAMGYSISSSVNNIFPSIRYAGRLAADPVNTFSQTEQTFFTGTASQTGSTRWGDYSAMTLDPDGCTFWYTTEYANPASQAFDQRWLTKFGNIGAFPGCTPVGAGGTVSGTVTVNPGGAPISGATVNLGSGRTTTTDGSGNYSFTSIPAGTYPSIDASKPGFGSASAASIVVTDGGTTAQNFALSDAADSACLTDTTQADFLTGVPTNLDLNTSPGDVTLSAPALDQSNTAGTTTGTGFGTPAWTGQTFIAGLTGPLVKADVQLFCNGCGGSPPNLTLSVRATNAGLPTGADLASTTIPGSAFASGGTTLFTATFGSPATVTSGTQYALILRPVSAPAGSGYFWIRSSPSTYANGSRVLSADSGGNWSADTTRDYNFKTYIQNYATSGTLISSPKDANPAAGFTPIWSTFSWNATTPANTTLQFQIAGSNNVNGPFNFVGPDGTAATFFTSSPVSLQPQFYNLRYLEYKAYFSTTDNALTPTLNDATFCFNDVDCSGVTATITPTPSTVCENSTGNTASAPAGMTSYAWSITNGTITSATNIQSITYTAGASGTVTLNLTVTAPNGCIVSGSQPVTINPFPATPTASNGGPYCEAQTIQLSTPTVAGATYEWTGPNGFTSSSQNPTRVNATTADGGTYSVTVTVGGCTSAAGNTNVVVNPTPATPTASNTGPYCEGQTIQLNTPTVAGATYAWTGPNGFTSSLQNPTRTGSTTADAGTYSVTVTVLGCTSAAGTTNVIVNANPSTPTITPGGPTTFCTGGSVTLTSSSATGNQWYLNNNPIGGATNQAYVVTASGDYTVVVTANNCASPASAPTTVTVSPTAITVINANDAGAGSLRQAIADLCDGGTIDFNIPGSGPDTITLSTGEFTIAKNLTIVGPTAKSLAISGGNLSRIFNVNAGLNFTFSNLTISGGNAAQGGAVNNLGNLTILNSTLSGNTASGAGGAIFTDGGVVRIINSTISGNNATSGGGGIYNGGNSQTTITNSTIASNNEGIRHVSSSPLLLNNTIVARNPNCEACDGIDVFVDNEVPTVTIDPASSNNLIGVDSGVIGITNGVNGNRIGSGEAPVNPLLGPLANNGGPTFTHALNNFSPAIDTGNNTLAVDQNSVALTTDQRGTGFPRIDHSVVDIGAFETTFVPPPPSADVGVTKLAGNEEKLADRDVVYTITVTNAGPETAANVTLNDVLPADLTFVSMPTPSGWSCTTPAGGSNGTVNCTNPNLAVGSLTTFTLTVHIPVSPSETEYHNVATVSTTTPDLDSDNNTASANFTLVTCLTDPVVTTNANSGAGSLRQAIIDACVGSTITFDMTQVVSPITLTSGELLIDKSLTITGPGANLLAISGNNASRVFNIQPSQTVTISGLTITNGKTLGDGGDVFNQGLTTLSACAITGGSSPNSGGGVANDAGSIVIRDCTISGNTATTAGGGIANGGTLTLVNSTISGNTGDGLSNLGSANLTNDTFSGNTVRGITNNGSATANVRNTIVANTPGSVGDVGGAFNSQGNNLIGKSDGSTGFTNGVNNDKVGTVASPLNALLASLANYGGPTQTHALLPGSPGIDAANNCVVDLAPCGESSTPQLTTDQRGFERQVNGTVDMGAFESRGFTISTTSGTPQSAVFNTAFGAPLVATVASTFSEPVSDGQVTFTAPGSGASATFTGGVTTINVTIASGQSSVPATANAIVGGPYNVTAAGNGITGTASYSLTNIKANQSINFGAIADKTFGDADFMVSPTATSGLPVSLAGSGQCTITSPSPGTVHITAAGACTITASQAGDANYNPASNVPQSFTINKANQTISFGALASKTFGDPDFVVSPTANSGLAVSLAASGNCTVTSPSPGTVHIIAAGSCTITASQAGDANYNAAPNVPQSFTINKANQTITFNALASKTFGDPDFVVSPTASSGLAVSLAASGNCTVTSPSPGTVHITGAGSCTITASQAGDANYNAAPNAPQSFTINKANQTITFNALANKTFGDPDFAVVATASSALPVSFAASGNCTVTSPSQGTIHLTGAGSCTITASQAGDANYNPAPNVPQTFNIAKAATNTSVSSTVNPSDLNQSVTFRAEVTSVATKTGTVQFKDNGTNLGAPVALDSLGVALFTTSSLTAGTHTITAEYSGDANFLPSAGTLSGGQVVRAQPSLSINDVSIVEGAAGTSVLNFTVTLSAASNLAVSTTFNTADATATAASDYVATNGTLTFNPGETSRTIAVTINGDTTFEADEIFTLNLSNPINTTISDNQGRGTILNDDALGGFISFSQANTNVNENAGVVTLIVSRGVISFGQANPADVLEAATVDYATEDTGASANCAAVNTGLASQRCDYTSVFGRLNFAANETQKTIDIPINLDAYNEGPEVFTVRLSNPTGGAVVIPATATVTINDSASPAPNAIDDTTTFVRQQYRDFLNRDADAAGLAFWIDNIDKCNDPARRPAGQTVAQCIEVQRIVTSAAFFLSIEFKQTGGMVREFYVAALDRPLSNNMPTFAEFMRDAQAIQKGVVVGQGNWQQVLDANRIAFMNDFVMRPEFVGLYPTTDTPTQYVDKLYLHAGVAGSTPEKLNAVAEFGGATTAAEPGARGRALLRVTQNVAFQAREANRTFVQIEYFGYLRRDPDIAGFNFWLNKLNQFNGDFLQAEMVKGFLSSSEYRGRFGP